MPTESLHISLLGDLQLTYGSDACTTVLHTVKTARLQALLSYLLLHRAAPQAREHLAFLFWPDTNEAQALTNLRNLLHKLRQALPTPERFLWLDARAVQWRPDAPYTLDVATFEQAVAQATTCTDLADAIELYHGELLPSCYEDWILPERERLRQLALDVLERLITLLEAQRDYRAAISYSQRLLQLEPFNEALYRRLMSLYAANADQAGALRVYQRCAAMLASEFAAEPAAVTQELYQRLQSPSVPAVPPTAHAPEQPPLIGRTAEWQALVQAWSGISHSHGRAHCLLVTGEAGIGKTRLAQELVTWIERQGYSAVTAHCYAAEGALTYAPVLAWLRSAPIYKKLPTVEPIWLSEVARLLPELLTAQPHLPPPGPMTAGWQRQRFFEALARTLLHGPQPRLLLIDDLQWCDRETLEWLHYLLHFAQTHLTPEGRRTNQSYGNLLLLGTVRSEAVAENHPLHTLLLTLRRNDQVTELPLGPLDAIETAALATAVTGQTLTPEQSTALYQETEGNPLFVVETVRADMARGEVGMKGRAGIGHWGIEGSNAPFPSPPPLTLSPKIHAVLQARLAELAPATRQLAGLAATIGRAFPFAVLAKASKQEEEELVCALDELCQRQIVREQSADTYDFTHDKLREATYNSLSAARRHLYHKQVAGALEAVYRNTNGAAGTQTLDTVSGQIATHYELAGDYRAAIHYYQKAAETAHQISANGEAVRAYRRALALAEGPSGQPPDSALYERLGDLLQSLSQYEEARAIFTKALSHATTMTAVQCACIHRKIGSTWREQYDYANAMQFYAAAETALEHADLHPPYRTTHPHLPADHPHTIQVQEVHKGAPAWWAEWLQTQLEIDLVHYWLGEIEESAALQRRLQPLVEQHATLGQQAAFFQRRGQLEFRRQRSVATAEAVSYIQRSFALYQEAGLLDALPAAHFMLGFMLLWHDDLDAAVTELQTALQLAKQHGDLSLQTRALTYLTIAVRRRNQVATTQELVIQALTAASNAHMPEYSALARANQAWLAWREGDYAAVRDHGAAALALWQQLPVTHASAPFQWTALWPLLAAALQEEELVTAVDYGRALLDPHQQQLPTSLATALAQAHQAWDDSAPAVALSLLHHAVALAQQLHYL